MQRIEFQNDQVHVKSGTSNKTGKPYAIREQEGYLHGLGGYPVQCRVMLGDEQKPYAPGFYDVLQPLSVGRFNALQVNRSLGLVPSKSAKAA